MNQQFQNYINNFKERETRMPAMFVGHGSPMNGIRDNEFTQGWVNAAQSMDLPSAVLVISAHWLTNGTQVTAMDFPKTIHDFGGFPQELFDVQYPASGSSELAELIQKDIYKTEVGLDHEWGLDHGAWTVVRHMFPDADIPVLQLSIDYFKPAQYHYDLAQQLANLRKKGVLIIGSGNMIHNLKMIDWQNIDNNIGYDWAEELNKKFVQIIENKEHSKLFNISELGEAAKLAIPTPDHYFPLLYSLGLQNSKEEVEIFNNHCVAGSLSMTSVKIG
ncbi:4,5-DOPA-extradiol-dioxygenase [Moheibacter sediminis]|uniref:4,5-DOPA dioxygenase extradiol n=1 Tax=Moheibacter sediminis TaxID=1434700 RepID=A0A1W1YHU7_9FLAO|nr:4,5-DOPA dioxygenase extradiol [Moheibacter sediminis]SMC35729.1 4,5-DOPA dioxygenase extradiol [Moheibacter sediminis]